MNALVRLTHVEKAEAKGCKYVDERGDVWRTRCPDKSNQYQVGSHVVVRSRKKRTTGIIVAALTQVKHPEHEKYRNSYWVVRRDDNRKLIMLQDSKLYGLVH